MENSTAPGESCIDAPTEFGEVLFDELKQIALRRGLVPLVGAKRRWECAVSEGDLRACESAMLKRWPCAVYAVRDLIRIVHQHAEALQPAPSSAEVAPINAALAEAATFLEEANSSARAAAGFGGDRTGALAKAILKFNEAVGCARRADAVVAGLSEERRRAQANGNRIEADERIADAARKAARDRDLVGVAFSGGGIRSATFNLGILQGLVGAAGSHDD